MVRSGQWQRLTHSTFLASPANPTDLQLAWAALLHCGARSALAGHNALVLHGWRDTLRKPFDVVCPNPMRQAPKWIRPRRVLTEQAMVTTPPRVNAHDATLQAAAWARSQRQAMYVVVSSLQQRMTSAPRLAELLAARPRLRRRGLISRVVDEYAGGSQSLNEVDLGAVCRKHGLPQPVRQVSRMDEFGTARSIDAEFEGPNGIIRVEVEGMHHFDPDNWLQTLRRSNALALSTDGIQLHYSSWTIRWEPLEFVNDLRRALSP